MHQLGPAAKAARIHGQQVVDLHHLIQPGRELVRAVWVFISGALDPGLDLADGDNG
jgi:hypothetical protein